VDKQEEEEEEKRFTLVSLDESFFFYDSLVRRLVLTKRMKDLW
jgi:hypothetical protein